MIAFLLRIQSAGKAAREEKSQATTDQSKSKPVSCSHASSRHLARCHAICPRAAWLLRFWSSVSGEHLYADGGVSYHPGCGREDEHWHAGLKSQAEGEGETRAVVHTFGAFLQISLLGSTGKRGGTGGRKQKSTRKRNEKSETTL